MFLLEMGMFGIDTINKLKVDQTNWATSLLQAL
jgi:hypothetical protein